MKRNLLIVISLMMILTLIITACGNDNGTSENENSNVNNIDTIFNGSDLFTGRDLEQVPETSDEVYDVSSTGDITITEEGIYTLTGTASNVTVTVDASDTEKVQLVLNGLKITNDNMPCIYIKSADKVFVTTTESESNLTVTGEFKIVDSVEFNGVIFSKTDITFNGVGTLNINSSKNGITGKDDVKITGGAYNIESKAVAIRANNSIRVSGGTFNIKAGTDGFHSENGDGDALGYIYINDCTINVLASDDAIHASSVVQIDGGAIKLSASEGIEGTYIQINDGDISINAQDDGINAGKKSNSYSPTFEMNGGNVSITISAGDTDGIDSNGDIIVNGGTITVTGTSTFDYDGKAEFNGGKIIVNGTEVKKIPNQKMGGKGEQKTK